MTTLLLDSDIRDWVVLPLFVIMIAAGLLRHNVGVLLKSDPQKAKYIVQRAQSTARHTSKLKSGASHYISTWQWQVRRLHYAQWLQQTADWCESDQAKEESGDSAAASDDPMANMMNPMAMMKGNMAFMVQNMVMMQGIQHFFSGYILLKVPFPLTIGFKQMFQRGLYDLPTLDTSYVSSVSWYFLVMFGLRSFFKLAIGDPPMEVREQGMMMNQLGQAPPNPMQQGKDGENMAKMLRAEADNLELFLQPSHKSNLDTVEKRLLGSRYPKRSVAYSSGSSDAQNLILGSRGGAKSKKKKAQ